MDNWKASPWWRSKLKRFTGAAPIFRSEEHTSALFPYTTLFRSGHECDGNGAGDGGGVSWTIGKRRRGGVRNSSALRERHQYSDRKSTRLHSFPTRRSSDLDMNATGMALVTEAAFHGQLESVAVVAFETQALYGSGTNIQSYVGANPCAGQDSLG